MTDLKYVPVLKAKEAEFAALKRLAVDDRPALRPLIEPLPEHLSKPEALMTSIDESWSSPSPLLLDFRFSLDDDRLPSVLLSASKIALVNGTSLVPVVRSSAGDQLLAASSAVAAKHGRGAAIRLGPDDFGDPQVVSTILPKLKTALGLNENDTDILFDLQLVPRAHEVPLAMVVANAIRKLPNVGAWRSLTVLGASFPEAVTMEDNQTLKRIRRVEWQIWKHAHTQNLPRMCDFGDYTIENPTLLEFKPKFMTVSPNLRYTSNDDWLVFKGRSPKKKGADQFRMFCRTLIKMPEYSGENASWGDQEIMVKARGGGGPGNPKIWRLIGISHHLAFVIQSLANIGGS